MQTKTGVFLINLGTPELPTVKAVRRYLREFLGDPRVIDLPWLPRILLLHGLILPFRPKQTAKAYQQIWTEKGSPLFIYSEQFKETLAKNLGEAYHIALGMRYGKPSIDAGILELKDCQRIIAMPLFPQYSDAATGSAIVALKRAAANLPTEKKPQLEIKKSFYADKHYLHLMAKKIKEARAQFKPDYLLLSYHGLPEKQLPKESCTKAFCDRNQPCLTQNPFVDCCYRAQCFFTSRSLATLMKLNHDQYQTVFQSRIGKTPWIKPYVDLELPKLAKKGVKRLMVVCPSFVVDCLETLEEIGIRLKKAWEALGGEAFHVVPCLNAEPEWAEVVAKMLRDDKIA